MHRALADLWESGQGFPQDLSQMSQEFWAAQPGKEGTGKRGEAAGKGLEQQEKGEQLPKYWDHGQDWQSLSHPWRCQCQAGTIWECGRCPCSEQEWDFEVPRIP